MTGNTGMPPQHDADGEAAGEQVEGGEQRVDVEVVGAAARDALQDPDRPGDERRIDASTA